MCGISGFVDFNKKTDRGILEKMNRTMAHRGPDGEGYAIFQPDSATVGLGHRRLSIIDLSEGGKQPKSYKHYHITFNGEIYNYVEIKHQLEAKGHQFSSHSDTEVVLHAFDEWGVKAIDQFIGMFAFVIYDEQQQTLTAFKDRAGVKPFFYYWKDGLFLFASELKAILQHPSFVKDIKAHADKAVKINPYNFKAWHIIGKWNYEVSNLNMLEKAATKVFYGGLPSSSFKAAIEAYEKAKALNPNFALNYLELAKAYKKNSEKAKAISMLKLAQNLPVKTEDDPRIKREAAELLKSWE